MWSSAEALIRSIGIEIRIKDDKIRLDSLTAFLKNDNQGFAQGEDFVTPEFH
jgi:hypothetical protein